MVGPMLHVIRALAIAGVFTAGCGWPYTSGSGSSSNPGNVGSATPPAGDAPVLQAANMVASVAPANGTYTISGFLTYSCDDDVVSTYRVTVPVLGKSYDQTAPGLANAYGIAFSFTLSDDIPLTSAGPTTYEIILITSGGVQSTPDIESVNLQ